MADNSLGMLFAQAIKAQAERPQKSYQRDVTTLTPTEYEDMAMRRDMIGQARTNLSDALKARQGFGYSLGSSLAKMQQPQGYGSWLGALASGFGAGLAAPTDAAIARAQSDYDTMRTDLADALMYDKEMGSRQVKENVMGYGPEGTSVAGTGIGLGAVDPKKLPAGADWLGMLDFDKARKDAESYRSQSQAGRWLSNLSTFMGGPEESAARSEFDRAKMIRLADARERLKGTGAITDFEDKKYSQDVEKLKDPVALYDYTFNWANNLNAVRAGVIPVEDVLFSMGITPDVIKAYGVPKVARRKDDGQ